MMPTQNSSVKKPTPVTIGIFFAVCKQYKDYKSANPNKDPLEDFPGFDYTRISQYLLNNNLTTTPLRPDRIERHLRYLWEYDLVSLRGNVFTLPKKGEDLFDFVNIIKNNDHFRTYALSDYTLLVFATLYTKPTAWWSLDEIAAYSSLTSYQVESGLITHAYDKDLNLEIVFSPIELKTEQRWDRETVSYRKVQLVKLAEEIILSKDPVLESMFPKEEIATPFLDEDKKDTNSKKIDLSPELVQIFEREAIHRGLDYVDVIQLALQTQGAIFADMQNHRKEKLVSLQAKIEECQGQIEKYAEQIRELQGNIS